MNSIPSPRLVVTPSPRPSARLARNAALLGVLGSLTSTALHAQEVPRYSITGEEAARAKRAALENEPYSLQSGNLKARFETGVEMEFSDNVNLAEHGRQADAIFRPSVLAKAFLPITAINSLNFSVGVSPALYVNHSEYDRVLITPGSELAFDFFVGDHAINLHDQFSYTQDPVSVGSISGSAVYGGFNNLAGARVIGDYNDVILSLGYDHSTFLSSTKRFEQLNNSAEVFNSHATFQFNRTISLGLAAGGGFNSYDQNFLNNHRNFHGGVDTLVTFSPRLSLSAEAGATVYQFDRTGTVGPTPDQTSYYAALGLRHKIGQSFSHSLRLSRDLQLGITSDVLEMWAVRYQADLRLTQYVTASPRFFYERGQELKSVGAETFDRYGFGVNFFRQLSERLRAGIGYSFTLKDSDQTQRSYRQNSVTLDVTYRF